MSDTPRPAKSKAKASASRSGSSFQPSPLPPRVAGKKKRVKRAKAVEAQDRGSADPPSEFLVPVILVGVSLVINVLTSLLLRPESVPPVLWLGIRMAIIVASSIITYGALFLAAQILDVEYGYISTGAVKVAAIALTQAWVGDLATRIPIPYVDWLLTFGTTYAMFKFFFELDDMEALASMVVVRLVHWIVIAFVFIAIMGAIMGGKNVDLSLPWQALEPAEADVERDEPEEAAR
jgi:hypothetical protein